jgi:hypothetical protein
MRAHKFSLVWFGESVEQLATIRGGYIGSEKLLGCTDQLLPVETEAVLATLKRLDGRRSKVVRKYFSDMRQALREMLRVLKPGCAAVVVVGTSHMRGLDVETHNCLAEIASVEGFELVGIAKRQLDRNRRLMPARFGVGSDSMIEQRIHEEYVIGLYKPVTSKPYVSY